MRIPIAQMNAGEAAEALELMAKEVLSLPGTLQSKLEMIERIAITITMRSCGHNKSEAARVLGMDRKALERRWQRFTGAESAEGQSAPAPGPAASEDTS